ncbi:carbohydrate ABC transporter substrate-binding protein (CUT1 family) [Jatrophihabitans sp. GAS493]|uniref:ABC transporter substrate-binding protein n=1 Tax=Jatrophihabitans sp. GAS493 TaxID=1907575 RepID=UPI000BB95E56|nr:ABC transporter substrate-binding protein [Jatrophihabitans sp. GAS493]SOD73300.1 carbohydrate ABC transporter substrate-binding protein (CUT1 family) [Jatrophihabitans sp. GAS493]
MQWNKVMAGTAIGTAAVLALAACSSDKKSTSSSVPTLTGDCAQYQAYAGHSGKKVTMFGSILSPESDSLQKSWADFEKCTGITITYTGSNDFESQLPVQVQGGSAPNLAIIPQPGLLAQMVKTGSVVKPPDQTVKNEDNWPAVYKTYGTVNGTFYAAPMSSNMKSLVWYSPSFFKANGYTVPTTWADLMSLSAKIAADGKAKPWCGGIGSGTATGWPATDWLEEAVLGTFGGSVYDDWISHKVKFSDAQIQTAMKTVASYMQNPAWVNGGYGDVKTIATTTFQDAGLPILKDKCGMLQQASFYEAQWPKGTKVGPDGQVFAFYLPAVDPSIQTPVEGGGEFVAAFSSDPAVQAVQNYVSSPEWVTSRVKVASGWVSANTKVPASTYTDPIDQISAKYLTDSSATFRFDASDLMPAAVGSGAEWKGMTEWFGSGKSTADVAKEIDAAWPN